MLLWFNSYASGLCYYYLLSNLLTIGQTLADPAHGGRFERSRPSCRPTPQDGESKGKKSKFQQRYEELMRQQEAMQRAKNSKK